MQCSYEDCSHSSYDGSEEFLNYLKKPLCLEHLKTVFQGVFLIKTKCSGTTKAGKPCTNNTTHGNFCHWHNPDEPKKSAKKCENCASTSTIKASDGKSYCSNHLPHVCPTCNTKYTVDASENGNCPSCSKPKTASGGGSSFYNKPKSTKVRTDYEILEISPTATQEEIRKAYIKLAKIWHPDKSRDPSTKSKFQEIDTAYRNIMSKFS
jgi:hypothetical protein